MDTNVIVADLVFMYIIRSSRLLCDIWILVWKSSGYLSLYKYHVAVPTPFHPS
jgi:hypothetical protein